MSTIRTLDRAISILQIVAAHPDGVGVSAIAVELGLAKSTISRLLTAMDSWEIVERTPENRYRIGAEPVRWVSHKPFSATLSVLARPILQQLAEETGEAVALCTLNGLQVYYLDHVQSRQDIQVRDWTGEQVPLHVSSAGKVLLAYAGQQQIDRFLERPLAPSTKQTITNPATFRKQLEEVRSQGFAISDEEFASEVFGLAVPIFGKRNAVVAAINVYGPKFRLKSPAKQRRIIAHMVTQAESLSLA
ncbi:MAG: IclR family transcriptional regulator [Anaerolineae bacterium]|nr:IclR family transcriptional regulator [Anaerolineae bacterium]